MPRTLIITTIVVVLLLLNTYTPTAIAAALCVDGSTASCPSGSGEIKGDVCQFACTCSATAATGEKSFNISGFCNNVLTRNQISSNATFQWLGVTVSSGTGLFNNTMTLVGEQGKPPQTWIASGPPSYSNAQALSYTNYTSINMTEFVRFDNYTALNVSIWGGIMPCVPLFGAMGVNPDYTGTTWWSAPHGMVPSYVKVDMLNRTVAYGSGAPTSQWDVLRSDITVKNSFRFALTGHRCMKQELAFRATLNIPGMPALVCPNLDVSSYKVPLATAPGVAAILKIQPQKMHNASTFNITINWLPTNISGGCANVTYQLSVVSLNVHQWGIFEYVSIVGSDPQVWHITNAELETGIQYAAVFTSSTEAGQGGQVISSPFSVPDGPTPPPGPPTTPSPSSGSSSMSVGTTVGIAVGVGIVAIVVGVGLFIYIKRRNQDYRPIQ